MGWTIHLARRLAIGVMVREDHFQVGTAYVEQLVGFCRHLHTWQRRYVARRQGARLAFNMHNAHAAGGGWLKFLVIAQIGNIGNTIIYRDTQESLTFISLYGLAINGESEAGMANIIAHHWPYRLLNYR